MAMIDYGAILKVNGVIKNRDQFFMDMLEAVGWVDKPRKRYDDCDCMDERGCSNCCDCPRHQGQHYSHPELGEWDVFDKDCRGNPISQFDKLDGNFFAFAGDEDFTVAVYKTHAVITRKGEEEPYCLWWDYRKFSETLTKYGVKVKIKAVNESRCVLYMRFVYKGDIYEIVYGYGVDSDQSVWNRAKGKYLDKKAIRFIDNFWIEKPR